VLWDLSGDALPLRLGWQSRVPRQCLGAMLLAAFPLASIVPRGLGDVFSFQVINTLIDN
jgi:adenine deaminase